MSKRSRPPRGPAPRVLRRKNVVQDDSEDDEDEEEEDDERMSGGDGEEEEDEEEEDEEDDDEEDEEDEEEEDDDEEEEEADQAQRRRSSDRVKAATPPPKKKLRRAANRSKPSGDGDESDEEIVGESDDEKDGSENEASESGGASAKKKSASRPAARRSLEKGKRREDNPDDGEDDDQAANDGSTNEGSAEDEEEQVVTPGKGKKRGRGPVIEEPGSEEEDADEIVSSSAAATPMDVDNDEEETKSESTPLPTPNASPVRRSGHAVETIAPPMAGRGDVVPFQNLYEQLRNSDSEQALLEVVSAACSNLIKDNKSANRLFTTGLLRAVKDDASRFAQPAVLKYLLRLLRSKHYGSSNKDGASEGLKKTPSTSSVVGGSGPVTVEAAAEMPLPVLITNVILYLLKDQGTWPEDSFKVFLDDALHGRVWVDHEFSQLFVRNVKAALSVPRGEVAGSSRAIEGKEASELRDLSLKHLRLRHQELERERGQSKGWRSFVLALIDFVSIPEARFIAAENLDTWLQNPATKGPAKELLAKVVAECKTMDPHDIRTVDLLLKLKLKPTMFQIKVETVSQLVRQHDGYLRLALTLFVSRERPNNMGKDVDNMKMLQQILRAARTPPSSQGAEESFYTVPPVHPAMVASRDLGFVFRDLASSTDVAPVLKTMVRKIIKQLASENIDIKTLCVELLKNDDHWDALAKYADMRMLDYMALVTGSVWLVLLMRGATVKNLQLQQANAPSGGSRQDSIANPVGGVVKLGSAQPIPRRTFQSVGAGASGPSARVSKTPGGSSASLSKSKQSVASSGKASPSSQGGVSITLPNSVASAAAAVSGASVSSSSHLQAESTGAPTSNKAVKVAVKAKEELQQTLAMVQRQSLVSCHEIFHKFGLSGKSAFEKSLYEVLVKKLLFLEIPPDVQPTEHDKACFMSTKEALPLHEDTLEMLTSLLSACEAVDRVEALRTLESVVFRAAEGHMHREEVWGAGHANELASYAANGGVLGIHVTRTAFVIDLLRLTVWTHEQKLEHEFCYSSRFWICCSILLIVGCFNPTTVGDFLWREIPTIRAIMQMLITGRFEFPSVATSSLPDIELFGGHRDNFSDLHQANAQLSEYEQHVMATLAPGAEDPLMLFEVQGVARQPPPPIIEHLKVLDRKFRLGTRLRQSRTKDFLMEMVATGTESRDNSVASDGNSDQSWWIADIVCEDVETVRYLPHECLCRLLLMALTQSSVSSIASNNGAPQKMRQLVAIVPRLQFKLREYLMDSGDVDKGAKVILYFLECFMSGSPRERRMASHILGVFTRDEVDSSETSSGPTSTPKSESDSAMDDTASSSLPADNFLSPLDDSHSAMNFDWLTGLIKLPCYSVVRDKVFVALESLLDRESSISSLTSCIKALHAFWKDASEQFHQDVASLSAATSKTKGAPAQPRSPSYTAAAEASSQLATTFGRLLSSREFVTHHLLQQSELCFIFADIFWSAIAFQFRPESDRVTSAKFTDCKVFYANDGSNTVREIKLPVPVIHGAIRLLCAPASDLASRIQSSSGFIAFDRLSECLFPRIKKESGTAILSSTGVIASKDKRLYPAELLQKMVRYAGSDHLVNAATKGLPVESLWEMVASSGLHNRAFVCITKALAEAIRSNETKALAALQDTAGKASDDDGVARILSSVRSRSEQSEAAWFVSNWMKTHQRNDTETEYTNDEDEDEALLTEFSGGFSIISRPAVVPSPSLTIPTFEDDGDDQAMASVPRPKEVTTVDSEWVSFKKAYPRLQQLMPSSTGNLLSKATELIIGDCQRGSTSSEDTAESSAWSKRIALLHCIRTACHSTAAAAQLGECVLQVVGHVATCDKATCLAHCSEFVASACDMVTRSFSSSATRSFLAQATCVTSLPIGISESLGDSSSSASTLSTIVSNILSCAQDWCRHHLDGAKLDPLTTLNLVVLIKDSELLRRASAVESSGVVWLDILVHIVKTSQTNADEATVVLVLDALLSAGPHLLAFSHSEEDHHAIQRQLIDGLYFTLPRVVSGHLDALFPGWKHAVRPRGKSSLLLLPKGAVEGIDTAIEELKRESVDAMDKLREFAVVEPVLMINRLLSLLQEWKGAVSLTMLYQKSTVFQSIARLVDAVTPSLVPDPEAIAIVLEFVFEILDTVVSHQAAEFAPLVSRMVAWLADIVFESYELVAEALFTSARVETLRGVASIYQAVAEIAAFADVLEHAHSKSYVLAALDSLSTARNRTVATVDEQRIVRGFIDRIQSSPVLSDAVPVADIEGPMAVVTQLLAKAIDQGTKVPLLCSLTKPVASLLHHEEISKAAMRTVCHALVSLMKHDPAHAVALIVHQYVHCLKTVRFALRETVLSHVAEFLSMADSSQRRAILELLYDDTSDTAKSKLLAYVKSPVFKA